MIRRPFMALVAVALCASLVPWATAGASGNSAHAHFESGGMHGFAAGDGIVLEVVEGASRQGRRALRATASTTLLPNATITTWSAADGTFLSLWVKGTSGATITLTDGAANSAPVRLDGAWQPIGLSVGNARPLEVRTLAGFAPGDELLIDDAMIASVEATTSRVVPGTRIIEVNDEPFVGQGYLYWTLPIGLHWPASTWADPPACQQDARLLGAAGVTLLRVPFEDHAAAVRSQYRECLDAFHANGIMILWLIGPPTQFETVEDTPVHVELYAEKVRTAVGEVGDHPATAIFTVGNEIERSNDGAMWLGNNQTGRLGMLETLIVAGKELDGDRHLWGSTICCPLFHWLERANVPSLDIWGLNSYGPPHNAATTLYDQLNAADPRPKIITETGTDRYFCIAGTVTVDAVVQTCKTSYRNPAGHSGERQVPQRDWNLRVWDQMAPNLATPDNPDGAVSGVTFFMYSDLWWFSLGFLTPQSPAQRQVGGIKPWAAPDGIINIEFHGVANAQPPGINPPRVTSLAFDALASRWSAIPPPHMSNIAATSDGTQITVTWETSEPATSELQAGMNGEDGRDGGEMREDNTIFDLVAYDPALKTEHSLTFPAIAVDSLVCWKVVARSFTPDGRSVTMSPLIVGCPSTARPGGD